MISFISHALFEKRQRNLKKYKTTLKEYTNSFHKATTLCYNFYSNYVRSMLLNDIGEDLLYVLDYSLEDEIRLTDNGYLKTDYTEYPFINPNSFFSVLDSNDFFVNNLKQEFSFFNEEYSITYKDNEFFFIKDGYVYVHFKLEPFDKIVFAGIDDKLYVSLFVETIRNNTPVTVYIKTHLSYDFFEFDYKNIPTTRLDDMETIHFIEIPKTLNGVDLFDINKVNILGSDFSAFYFNVKDKVYKLLFMKKCYFVVEDKIYHTLRPEEARSPYLDRTKVFRSEHPYFYDTVDMFGLNELKDLVTLTTYDAVYLKNYKFEFGNHLNGFYNYFNFRIRKDYFLTLDKVFFYISGNFNHENSIGSYELQVHYYPDGKCFAKLFKESFLVNETELYFYEGVAFYKNLKIYKKFIDTDIKVYDIFNFVINDEYEYFMDYIEHNENYEISPIRKIEDESMEYFLNNKLTKNDQDCFKKEPVTLLPIKGNLYIADYIIDEFSRSGNLGFTEISLLDENNKITSLWSTLANGPHALINEYNVVNKNLFISENQTQAFNITSKNFILDFQKIVNKKREL